MMKRYLLAHDLGTSGNKATLFTLDGELVDSKLSAYPTDYSHDNWAEQDPRKWWNAVCESTRALLKGHDAKEVAAVSFSGQMMGCLCVDAEGVPLRNSIIYSDQRAETQTQRLAGRLSPLEIYRITGHRISPSYSVEKLMWVKDNEPEIYARTFKMLNAKDYMNFKLTGQMRTDHNDASGTNAFDISSRQWSDRVLDAAEIDPRKLPLAVESINVIGEVTRAAAEETGLAAGTPVVAGAGDGGCATVGAGSVAPGVTYNYLGSSSWISTTTREPIFDDSQRTFTWVHPVPGFYQPCGTMQTAGSAYSWLKQEICTKETQDAETRGLDVFELMNEAVEKSPPGANGVIFLPYLLGERSPRWNPRAKGAWIGLKLETRREDILRSVLEGVSLNLEIILAIMRKFVSIGEITLIGGGAKGKLWRQMLADVFGIPVLVPHYLEEATSMGAAIIGGVGVGSFKDFGAVKQFITIDETVTPRADVSATYQALKPVFDECYQRLEPVFERM
jgi:xylulokinase